jgi:hypothetical protein
MITSYDVKELPDKLKVSVYWHTYEEQSVVFDTEQSLEDYDLWLPDYPEIEAKLIDWLLNN